MSSNPHETPTRLSRRLSTFDAVIIGLGAMIGAGIFVSMAPAAAAAGSGLIFGLALAGLVAYLNATAMAQLAAVYPESGGTYVYGRKQLGHYWGFLAGWGFVIGKIASCTAMALTFGYYVYPEMAHPIAVGIVILLTIVNYFGITKTALMTRFIVLVVLTILVVIVTAGILGGDPQVSRLSNFTSKGGITGILEAAGMMFFAFAGYARLATLGEEVIDPKRTIPRAILIALAITILIYGVVVLTALLTLPIEELAASRAPLEAVVLHSRYSQLAPIARIGAAIASMGVLLSLLAGISRTVFAMAANRDLPHSLSAIHPQHKIPHRAEILLGGIIALVVGFADLRTAIGFSSFAILIYYAIANAAAARLHPKRRLYPKWQAGLGLCICLLIAISLPKASVIGGIVLLGAGSGYFWLVRRRQE